MLNFSDLINTEILLKKKLSTYVKLNFFDVKGHVRNNQKMNEEKFQPYTPWGIDVSIVHLF